MIFILTLMAISSRFAQRSLNSLRWENLTFSRLSSSSRVSRGPTSGSRPADSLASVKDTSLITSSWSRPHWDTTGSHLSFCSESPAHSTVSERSRGQIWTAEWNTSCRTLLSVTLSRLRASGGW